MTAARDRPGQPQPPDIITQQLAVAFNAVFTLFTFGFCYSNSVLPYSLSTLETIVAEIGDNLPPPILATIWRQSPFSVTVAEFGDSRRNRRL